MYIAVYSDGGLAGPNPSLVGGSWAYALADSFDITIVRGSGTVTPEQIGLPAVTNNLTEWIGAVRGLEVALHYAPLRVELYTDSEVTARRIRKLQLRQRHDVKMKGLPPYWVTRMYAAIQWLRGVTVHLLAGHPSQAALHLGKDGRGVMVSRHNVDCDRQCRALAEKLQAEHAARRGPPAGGHSACEGSPASCPSGSPAPRPASPPTAGA